MNTSHHAETRIQQRAIPKLIIDLLLEFGASEPAGRGTSKVFFDKSARRKVKAYAGALSKMLEEHLNIYAVVGDDEKVITVGHRFERIHRH